MYLSFRYILSFLLITSTFCSMYAQQFYGDNPFAHTFSIVAIDPETGDMGVAVQSHWFAVGTTVIWGEAGVGVVATQSFINPAYGPDGLALMKMGFSAKEALKILVEKDEAKAVRQLAFLDATGNVSNYTGENCIDYAGSVLGDGYSIQANLMSSEQVWPMMAKAFEESKGMPLAERLVLALEAGQKAGGDLRGRQSASILVVRAKSTGKIWQDRLVDLRVEDHPNPVQELKRLVKVHTAYGHMNSGDQALESGDIPKAIEEYGMAEKLIPDNVEMKYWHAVTLANLHRLDEALPLFEIAFHESDNWRIVTRNLIKSNLLEISPKELDEILSIQ